MTGGPGFGFSDLVSSELGFEDEDLHDESPDWGSPTPAPAQASQPESEAPPANGPVFGEADAILGVLKGAERARAQVGALVGRLSGVIDRTEATIGVRSFAPMDIYAGRGKQSAGLLDDMPTGEAT